MATTVMRQSERKKRKMYDLPELATPKQIAELLSISESSLAQDRYLSQGIPFIRIGRRVRYQRDDVIAFLTANRVEVSA